MDKRIETALRMVTDCRDCTADGYTIFDIGADHANLTIALRRALPRARLVASDIREGPLSAARANVTRVLGENHGVEFILSDGFTNIRCLQYFPADCAVIMGMGGETIADIIAGYSFPRRPRLILGPHTKHDVLRQSLAELSYIITREETVTSKKHTYQLWEAVSGHS